MLGPGVIEELLSVVGDDDHQGIVPVAQLIEPVEEVAEPCVGVRDLRKIQRL